jgi:hypothetical protein
MALLLLRHALTLTDEDDDDTSAMFSVSEITILKNILLAMYNNTCFFNGLQLKAFSVACCWFPASVLHHGLGNQYLAAPQTETGQLIISKVNICIFLFLFFEGSGNT